MDITSSSFGTDSLREESKKIKGNLLLKSKNFNSLNPVIPLAPSSNSTIKMNKAKVSPMLSFKPIFIFSNLFLKCYIKFFKCPHFILSFFNNIFIVAMNFGKIVGYIQILNIITAIKKDFLNFNLETSPMDRLNRIVNNNPSLNNLIVSEILIPNYDLWLQFYSNPKAFNFIYKFLLANIFYLLFNTIVYIHLRASLILLAIAFGIMWNDFLWNIPVFREFSLFIVNLLEEYTSFRIPRFSLLNENNLFSHVVQHYNDQPSSNLVSITSSRQESLWQNAFSYDNLTSQSPLLYAIFLVTLGSLMILIVTSVFGEADPISDLRMQGNYIGNAIWNSIEAGYQYLFGLNTNAANAIPVFNPEDAYPTPPPTRPNSPIPTDTLTTWLDSIKNFFNHIFK